MRGRMVMALILCAVGGTARRAAAQEVVASDAMAEARTKIGTAKLTAVRLGQRDSLIVSVIDDELSIEAFEEGAWQFGGRSEKARSIGREVAVAIRAGLPATSLVKTIVIEVVSGTTLPRTAIRLPYPVADLKRP